jgi:uncharacterized protein YgbK (DUF1537 family)
MPAVEDETGDWSATVCGALDRSGRALMIIQRPVDRTPGVGERFQSIIAETVSRVLACCRVSNLLLEGGATASAVCRQLRWNEFAVEGELAPGVVQLRVANSDEQRIIVKPGSYPWPQAVWRTTNHA